MVWAPRSGRTRSKQSYACGFMPTPLAAGVCARARAHPRLCGVLCPVDLWCLPLLKPPGCGGRGLHLGDLISPNHFPKAQPLHIMGGLSFHPHNPSNKGLWGLNPSGEGTVFTRKQVPGWGDSHWGSVPPPTPGGVRSLPLLLCPPSNLFPVPECPRPPPYLRSSGLH